jgi:uncharacterized protein (DUF58 family)
MTGGAPHPDDERLLAARRRAVDRQTRARLGLLRRLARSNRLFPRKLDITREGKWIIGIALLLGIAAINTGNNLLYLVLSLVISLITVSGILSEATLRSVQVDRRYPRELTAGEPTLLRAEVHNRKPRRAFNIEVREIVDGDELPLRPGFLLSLDPEQTGQCFQVVEAQRRGPLRTVGLSISTTYPFGFARKSRFLPEPAHFVALPPVKPPEVATRGGRAEGDHERARRLGQGGEFRGLREARQGDSLRDIHWKVSARRDRLIAREWESEATRVVIVRFEHFASAPPDASSPPPDPDPDRAIAAAVAAGDATSPAALDAGCSAVAGVCEAMLERGLAVGLQTFDGVVPPVADPDGGGGQLLAIRRHLARLLPADVPPPADWPIDDGPWLDRYRRAEALRAALHQGAPIDWPQRVGFGRFDVVRVAWASRAETRVGAAVASLELLLDEHGQIVAEHVAGGRALRGAA